MPAQLTPFHSFDDTKLGYRAWLVDKPKGNLVVVHGAGEHSLRYQNIVSYFNALDFNVFTWDARGHGESEGQQGFVDRWYFFRRDIHCYFQAIRSHFGDLPVFLLGHSLGGAMTLDYLLHHQHEDIRGYICSSPPIGGVGISPVLMLASRLFTHLTPRLSLDSGLEINALSRDEQWLESTRADKLYHSKGTPRLATELMDAADWIQAHADRLTYPIAMVHGTADTVCDINGSREFFKNTTQSDKTLWEYEGGYHELFNDLDKQRVLGDVHQWMQQRL